MEECVEIYLVLVSLKYSEIIGRRRAGGENGEELATLGGMMYFSDVYFTAHRGLKIIHNVSSIKETRTIYCSGG